MGAHLHPRRGAHRPDLQADAHFLRRFLDLLCCYAIDGACSCTNIIYIFTTNYPERIDQRFLRAGRIDKQIEIGYVCDEVMNQCLNAHFGKGLPEDRTTAESVTIAQMNIDLMSEATYEQIVEKYTIKKYFRCNV